MDGDDLIELFAEVVSNGTLTVSPSYVLQLINIARADYEQRRMWQVLKAKNTALTAASGFNPTTAYAMPSPVSPSLNDPYAMQYLLEGAMLLVDPINSQNYMPLLELPFENQVGIQQGNAFYVDYAKREFYIMANLSGSFTIYQFFQADFGDIKATLAGDAVNTSWVGFPAKFAPMLAFQAAARQRLGSDYDDISARNADNNFNTAETLFKSAMKWDANLALNGYQHRPYMGIVGGNNGSGFGGYGPGGQTIWPWANGAGGGGYLG